MDQIERLLSEVSSKLGFPDTTGRVWEETWEEFTAILFVVASDRQRRRIISGLKAILEVWGAGDD